jgi:hypothetical protein
VGFRVSQQAESQLNIPFEARNRFWIFAIGMDICAVIDPGVAFVFVNIYRTNGGDL